MDGYSLSKAYWAFAFENTERCRPNHAALFMYTIEHANKMGWKEAFGLPTGLVMEAIGIKSYSVYKKTFDDLVEFGFIEVLQYSKNQYTANVIALKENCKASSKAHNKAHVNHLTKHIATHGEYNKTVNLETEKQIETLTDSLASANAEVQRLSAELVEKNAEIEALKITLDKERKKVARKKKEESTPHWSAMKELWIEFFKSKNDGLEPTFEGAEGTALASILKRLQKHSAIKPNTKDKAWTAEYAGYVFSHFLQRAYKDQFRADNLRLPLLSSHYDSIITGNDTANTKNGKQATGANVDTGSAFAAIDRHFGKT